MRFQWCVDKCLTTDSLGESESSLLTASVDSAMQNFPHCPPLATSVMPLKLAPGEALVRALEHAVPAPGHCCAQPRRHAGPVSLSFSLPSVPLRRGCASPVPGSSHRGQLESSSQQLPWAVLLVPVFRRGQRHRRSGHPVEPALETDLWSDSPFLLATVSTTECLFLKGSVHGTVWSYGQRSLWKRPSL